MPLHQRIFLGLFIGAILGLVSQWVLGSDDERVRWFVANITDPIGQIFLRMIFMIVVPLLISALVMGVADLGSAGKIGRVGLRSLVMTILLSSIAVTLGLLAVNTVRPGDGIDSTKRESLISTYTTQSAQQEAAKSVERAKETKPFAQTIVEIIPDNPFISVTGALSGGLLSLMFFALVFGIALGSVSPDTGEPLKNFFRSLFAVSLKVIDFAMLLAPLGVACLIFKTTAILGFDAMLALGKYMLTVLGALAIHQFFVYSFVLWTIARRNPVNFFSQISEVLMTAFATSSSNATLPTALRVAEENVKVPREINQFVLTLGATGNQNGTALFEGITVLFLAQFFGIELSLAEQIGVMGLAILAGVGTAGVPGGAWPMIAVILNSYKIPTAGIGLVLGIDRILDMSRTVLNVTGDITIATCVAEMERRSKK
ncbi:MAG TPA: dicarboxylate/amino acid:cation symporter [Fimbriimonadales bacterium]|nr:dicarboxylate/amino acid:cation symporter [Fimbriimonadales bacterium]